jgi:hypothetical protein
MNSLHRWIGWTTFVLFLATGQYMRRVAGVEGAGDAVRYLYRANHIYLLFVALVHLALGTYLAEAVLSGRRRAQRAGSTLLTIGTLLLAWAFAVEPPQATPQRPITRYGIFTFAAGMAVHVIAGRKLSVDRKAGDA